MLFPLELLGLLVCVAIVYRVGSINSVTSIFLRKVSLFFSTPDVSPRDPLFRYFKAGHCSLLEVSDFRLKKFLPAFPLFTETELFFIVLTTVTLYTFFLIATLTIRSLPAEYLGFVAFVFLFALGFLMRHPLSAALQAPMRSRPALATVITSVIIGTIVSILLFAGGAPETILRNLLSVPFDKASSQHTARMSKMASELVSQAAGTSTIATLPALARVCGQLLRMLGGVVVVLSAVALGRSVRFEATMLEIVNGAPSTVGSDRPFFQRIVRDALPGRASRTFSLALLFLALLSYLPPVESFIADVNVPYGASTDSYVRFPVVVRSCLFLLFALTRLSAVPGLVQSFLLRSATPYVNAAEASAFLSNQETPALQREKQFPLSGKPELVRQAELAQRSVLLRTMDMATGPAIVLVLAASSLIVALYAPGGANGPVALTSVSDSSDVALFPFSRTASALSWGQHWAADAYLDLAPAGGESLRPLPSALEADVLLFRDRPLGRMARGVEVVPQEVSSSPSETADVSITSVIKNSTSKPSVASDLLTIFASPAVFVFWLQAVLLGVSLVYLASLAFHHAMSRANLAQGQTLGSIGASAFSAGIESSGGESIITGGGNGDGKVYLSSSSFVTSNDAAVRNRKATVTEIIAE